jgi:hypothetical protein
MQQIASELASRQVFFPALREPKPGYDIKTILKRRTTFGDVGIEIECEGNVFQKSNEKLGPYWCYHEDHSLRGADSAEYVLCEPIQFKEVPNALDFLWKVFEQTGTVLDDSNRTSVHVHLNVQKFCLNRLTAFAALWFSFEEILAEWAGEHRVGNLFCLRAKDAPAIINKLRKWIKSEGQAELTDGLHYAGFNVNALHKFGSVEIRFLRGCTDKQHILDWVAVLQRLYELSAEFPDPRDVIGAFSYGGPTGYFDEILGDVAKIVRGGIEMSEEQIRDSLYDGIRIAQDLCYCRDWSLYKPVEIREDPFGRPTRTAKSLGGFSPSALSTFSITSQAQAIYNEIHSISAAIPIPMPSPIPSTQEMDIIPFPADGFEAQTPEPEWLDEDHYEEEPEPEYDEDESNDTDF